MHQFFKSTFFNFEFVRILSAAPFGGADIAECLVACSQIRDNDAESWHRAWYAQAEKVEVLGNQAMLAGDIVSARRAWLRASNYFRASAYMFLDRDRRNPEPRVPEAAAKMATVFRKGVKLLENTDVSQLEIPIESGRCLPGYLYTPGGDRKTGPTPLLIHLGGADSTQEELYYVYASSGPEIGYAVLTFDGPGQGLVLRRDKMYSRPDWEIVISHVLDFVETLAARRPELQLDLSRISVTGASMGGYYALRSAADPRVRACVAIDPFYDMYDFAVEHVGAVFSRILGAWATGWVPTTVVNSLMRTAMAVDFRTGWEVGIVQWFMGVASPTQSLLEMRRYSLRLDDGTSFLKRVKCPVLVSGAGQSLYLQPGTDVKRIYQGLQNLKEEDKSVWIATKPEEGGLQAKIGAIGLSAQKTFEFLDKHLKVVRPEGSIKEH